MGTISRLTHGMLLTFDTITSSMVTTRHEVSVACNNNSGVLFMLFPHGGGNDVTRVEVSTSNKGVVQRMWQGLMSSRLELFD